MFPYAFLLRKNQDSKLKKRRNTHGVSPFLSLGFDFSGFIDQDCLSAFLEDTSNPNVLGLKEFKDTPNLIKELQKRGYTQDEIEKIGYKNAFRVIQQVL